MPRVSEMIVSKYLRKEDVDDELVVTIKDLKLEDMPGDNKEQRWILYFRELPKGLVLNTTTIKVCGKAFGDDADGWTGKKVTLYVDEGVMFKGQVVGGLRLRPLKPPKGLGTVIAGGPAPTPPAATDFELNDEIP